MRIFAGQVDSHLHCSTHPSTPPSLISAAAAVLGSLLLHYTAANEDFADLSQLWTGSLHFYSTYSLAQVLFHNLKFSSELVNSFNYAHRWFPSHSNCWWCWAIPSTQGLAPSTSPGLVSIKLVCRLFHFFISWLRSQHSRLADLPHLAANVIKNAHEATFAQQQQDSTRP